MAGAAEAPAPLEATGTVLAAEPLTPSIRRLVVALPPEVRLRYRAGMHVELRTPGIARPRTYSIATAPDREGLPPDGLLEFFVTRHEGGQASGWLHGADRLGGALQLHGPYGTFGLPEGALRPLLCLAGGSGILSVRDRAEVFALDALHALARRHANFSYLVTLTRETAVDPATGWRHGRIPEWLGQEFFDLSGFTVLAAGPPGFVEACVATVLRLGASPEQVLTDSFTPTIP
ncbi:MAG: 2Fe-2S iron-sulfur cluster binding domain protein [Geminicoccaceae bacterium]|nr:2Fe-2S iron-sulfur cluster binding domain protein [Geminicoccaceae bacterium]